MPGHTKDIFPYDPAANLASEVRNCFPLAIMLSSVPVDSAGAYNVKVRISRFLINVTVTR